MTRLLMVALAALFLTGCQGMMGGEGGGRLGDGQIQISDAITLFALMNGGGGAGALSGLLGGGGGLGGAVSGPESLEASRAWLCEGMTVKDAAEFGEDRRQRLCAELSNPTSATAGR